MPSVHPTAIVPEGANIADDVVIGPFCVLEGDVMLAPGVRLVSNVQLRGPITIGAGTQVWPFACLGLPPQDFKFGPDAVTAGTRIGEGCIIREYASVHAATNDHTPTAIGDRVFMMGMTHVGHDGKVGNDVVMVNYAGLAGHVTIGDRAILSGQAVVHQFCRIGRLAMMSAGTAVSADVPPFCVVNERQRMGGVNLVGMRRSGMAREEITAVKTAFREAFRRTMPKGELQAMLDDMALKSEAVREMADFVRDAKRPICPGRGKPARLGVTGSVGGGADDEDTL